MRILHAGSKAQDRVILETMVCRILVFAWSCGPFVLSEGIEVAVAILPGRLKFLVLQSSSRLLFNYPKLQ